MNLFNQKSFIQLLRMQVMLLLMPIPAFAVSQYTFSGQIIDKNSNKPLNGVELYLGAASKTSITNSKGEFEFNNLTPGSYDLIIYLENYETRQEVIEITQNARIDFSLEKLDITLAEVIVKEQQEEVFALRRLKSVEDMAIYSGKKNEVVLLDRLTANKAANNARQIYSQVVGLNIFEADDAGLQLNIGGRGLDPNRTASFNTRQNGYDISADVLGYPESYYSPPSEALQQIQIIRGAASLQYGTQFGGLVNFIFKKPNPNRKLELITRQSTGSNGLFTTFNAISGTVNKFSYYTYINYKRGDGFRPNSEFNSIKSGCLKYTYVPLPEKIGNTNTLQ